MKILAPVNSINEVEEVIDDEGGDDHATPAHGPGGVGEEQGLFFGVLPSPSAPALKVDLQRRKHVKPHTQEQNHPEDPEARHVREERIPDLPEEFGVMVEGVSPHEDLQVSDHVGHQEPDQDRT